MEDQNNDISKEELFENIALDNKRKLTRDYSILLQDYGLLFKRDEHYLQVGEIDWIQGWIIDISVIYTQLQNLLHSIIPFLIQENVSFKIVRTLKTARSITSGQLGINLLGKTVSIYPSDQLKAVNIAQKLITLTSMFKGPDILTDRQLKGIIYTRYGACNAVIKMDEYGSPLKYIHDKDGNLVPDPFNIPFILPSGVHWPFDIIASATVPKKETVLLDKYKPIATLKMDTKGNVLKGLWLKKWYLIKWCIIKEGKRHMISDSMNRDAADRLRWQFELQKDLMSLLPIPEPYDLFEENGDTYFVMQYIKGIGLNDIIIDTINGQIWQQLPLNNRLSLINYALQLLNIIEKLHQKGYIHRDITPPNFMVDRKGQLWMIDLELSYNIHSKRPTPPFRLGTPGFTSPEQIETKPPAVEQDIYAIGATLVVLFTGLLPDGFSITDYSILKKQLNFFIPDLEMINILANCFNAEPEKRPSIQQIRETLKTFNTKQEITINPNSSVPFLSPHNMTNLEKTIISAIIGLNSSKMTNQELLWVSPSISASEIKSEESVTAHHNFYNGISGILYVIARAKKIGLPINSVERIYKANLDFLLKSLDNRLDQISGGFFFGTAGLSISIIEGIQSGLISNNNEIREVIKNCLFNKTVNGNGIIKGESGQGLALLRAIPILSESFVLPLLNEKIEQLIARQQKDGSWITISEKNKRSLKITGLGHGVAGIVCFLLEYIKRYPNYQVQKSVLKALEWLQRQANQNQALLWKINNISKASSDNLLEGSGGIMLAMIKGYEVFKDPNYRKLAEISLRNYPQYGVYRDLTLSTGLIGFGEVCLEAATIFNNEEWRERVEWIISLLLNYYHQNSNGSVYWLPNGSTSLNPGLMTGNGGIIHFLLRYSSFENVSHPLLTV